MSQQDAAAEVPFEISLNGWELLAEPLLNKGMAFSVAERDLFGLHGLLPPHVLTMADQVTRRLRALRALPSDYDRYNFLRELQDTNETLYHAVLTQNLDELLPVVYTPTVGLGCERFSHAWRRPRGLFLSIPLKDRIAEIISHPRFDRVRVIVVSDGERILGLGDQGAGGMGIPIGKLALYTACAGIHPSETLPILLDVGTDNEERLNDPLYIGWRHGRVRGEEYNEFVEAFISAVTARWPGVLLQFEDFARANAGRLLDKYRDRLCTFNDDIQGTAAVATGTVLAAINVTGVPMAEQRIAILGAGSAGCGIGNLLLHAMMDAGVPEAQARAQFFAVDRDGLLVEGQAGLQSFQQPFVKARADVAGWALEKRDFIGLADVMRNAKPTVLIGTSAQPGAFTEEIVRAMAEHVERPVIFPLSNPVSRAEARPSDVIAWTDGRAVVGTGSPFPVVMRDGKRVPIAQANNAYIFPGVGLGVLAVGAPRVTDAMFMAAAKALAAASPAANGGAERNLLPEVSQLREIARSVAVAVARQAQAEGLAPLLCENESDAALDARVRAQMWAPHYWSYSKRGA